MKKFNTHFLIVILGIFTISNLFAQDVNVTFKVDMTGAVVGDNGIAIAGGMNEWALSDHLSLNSESGLYEITMELTPGEIYEFKYVNLAVNGTDTVWGDVSGLCAYAGTGNRAISVPDVDTELDAVTLAGCIDGKNNMVNMIFQVDMSSETVNASGVYVTGGFPGKSWWTDGFQLTEVTDGVYADTIALVPGQGIEYKYLNGSSWDGQETAIPVEVKHGDNRGVYVPDSLNKFVAIPVTPYNGSPTLYDVTFNISDGSSAINGASLNIFNKTLEITENGDTTLALADGYYPYTVTAVGYYNYSGWVTVKGMDITDETIELTSAVKGITFSLVDSNNVAPNALPKITMTHSLLKADGSEITNDNITELLTFSDNSGEIEFSASINSGENEITFIPEILLASATEYTYGIKDNVIKFSDDEAIGDTSATFTVKMYTAVLDTYVNFDGINEVSEFKFKGADDHVGASAQPFFSSTPASSDNKALKFVKGTGSWGGWGKFEVDLNAPIDLSTGKIFSFKVYSPKVCKVRFAVTDENNSEGSIQVETGDNAPYDIHITKANEWQTIYVDLTEGNFVDTVDYSHILICFDAGQDNDETYYVDDITGPSLLESTGIDNQVVQNLKLYPNPAKNSITVEAENNIESVEFYNISGQRISTRDAINNTRVTLDISSFKPGIYFVKANSAGAVKILKLMIE